MTWETPERASTLRRIVVSATVRRSIGSWRSEVSARNMISPMIDEIGASTGVSTSVGSDELTSWSFSATTCRARWISTPHSNSTQTTEKPTAVEERTLRTPDAPLRAASMGKVTSVSTSSGAIPCASVMTVTVGAVRSGKTSTGMRSVS